MKKVSLMLALVFSLAAVNTFAGDKDKAMKCTPGKECCKKMSKTSAAEKEKCKKLCDKAAAEKKAA